MVECWRQVERGLLCPGSGSLGDRGIWLLGFRPTTGQPPLPAAGTAPLPTTGQPPARARIRVASSMAAGPALGCASDRGEAAEAAFTNTR